MVEFWGRVYEKRLSRSLIENLSVCVRWGDVKRCHLLQSCEWLYSEKCSFFSNLSYRWRGVSLVLSVVMGVTFRGVQGSPGKFVKDGPKVIITIRDFTATSIFSTSFSCMRHCISRALISSPPEVGYDFFSVIFMFPQFDCSQHAFTDDTSIYQWSPGFSDVRILLW